ncbi:methionyl-tRNA formyltransferase [Alkalispirochaeta americana]|uniref:Methionyl-tRNA formyltransferase n=1 Tax=Alkalispirochaeta americana TaxID=159291 RepID=A0A1N6VMG8_9SPIO|nr:methionyl-tRNA formyltransferase [Alkalispirochaeta americana]SIQ78938.1 methionyl-tRNA formyltransferase [Alkalispirochaeta americana]
MRLLFAGTPDIALPTLRTLEKTRHEIVGVLTAPDAPAGRRRVLTPPPVKVWAEDKNTPVIQPERLGAAARQEVAALKPELLVVVAYGKIFGPRFLELFPQGGINMHPSLLPRHRGPSPIPAALLAGDQITGVTVQYLALEMDAGDILEQREVPLSSRATAVELYHELGVLGGEAVASVVEHIARGTARPRRQVAEDATWCHLIRKGEGDLTWQESAVVIDRMVRAYTPWPGVRCRWGETPLQLLETEPLPEHSSCEIPIHRQGVSGPSREAAPGTVLGVDNGKGILIQTVDGILAVRRLKLQARKEADYRSFLNGNSSIIGSVLNVGSVVKQA